MVMTKFPLNAFGVIIVSVKGKKDAIPNFACSVSVNAICGLLK